MSEPISDIIATVKRGRPSKYTPESVNDLLAALANGLTQKQACKLIRICENTLAAWRRGYTEHSIRDASYASTHGLLFASSNVITR